MTQTSPDDSRPPAALFSTLCMIHSERQEFFAELNAALTSFKGPVLEAGRAFRRNIDESAVIAGVPFGLALEIVIGRQTAAFRDAEWKKVATPQRIVDAMLSNQRVAFSEEERKAARDRGTQRMVEFVDSAEGLAQLKREALEYLRNSTSTRIVSRELEALLRQATVLAWSSVETLIRDLHTEVFGQEYSGIASALRLALGRPTETKEALLRSLQLWALFNARHVIVHRGGELDDAYFSAIGQSGESGPRITVSAADLEEHLRLAVTAGICLLKRANGSSTA